MIAWARANPGRAIGLGLLSVFACLFVYVVARGWIIPCVLKIGTCS